MTAMRLKRYPSPSGGFALGKMGVGATMLKQGKTAKDYVQNGLIAMWDGIENAGWGVHDANATIWVDLSGNGNNLSPLNGAHFDYNSLVSANRNNGTAEIEKQFPWSTIEVCAFFDSSRNSSLFVSGGNSVDSDRILCAGSGSIQYYNGMYSMTLATPVAAKSTWAATYDEIAKTPYVNGSAATGTLSRNNWGNLPGNFMLSGRTGNAMWNFVGNYYCVRLYSRALSASEIAANYAIDKERFNLP